MYSKGHEEQDIGDTNINQFIRLNNRLRANGFLSIPFLPDISSPARSLIFNQDQIEDKNVRENYIKYLNTGKSEKFIQTGQNSQESNIILTPNVLPTINESITPNELEITPNNNKFPNSSQYPILNTDDFRTVGSIINDICNDDIPSVKEQIKDFQINNLSISKQEKMELPFELSGTYNGNNNIELSFVQDTLKLPPQAISSEPQRLIVDGNKLINTIHNLLYELESRSEHTVEAINIERSQKNGLIEKLNLLKKKYDVLEKENESLRAINRSLSDEELINKKNKNNKDNTHIISKLEREKQQLIVENSRLKQDILKLQEDDDRSRDKADQFLKLIKNTIDREQEINRNNMISNNQNTITFSEKKKLLQSHYLYSIIVGYEKSINYWKSQINNNKKNDFEDHFEIDQSKQNETIIDKNFFEYCHNNNISASELMKRDKILWSRGLYLLQNTERSELENIIRWSCRLLNTSNFRNIPIFIGSLISKKNKDKSPKISHVFESSNSRIVYSNNSPKNDTQNIDISNELYDRFYNHFKTLFDVLDDQDIIQVSNSVYIQLRDFKKLFRVVCNSFNLDDKTTTISECIKIFNDYFSINANNIKNVNNKQPQIHDPSNNQLYSNDPNAQNIIESLKIVLDVESSDQILPTLKQHLESQSAIILSLSKN